MKVQPPYENFDIAFPVFEGEDWHTNPLYGAFCWVNKDNPNEHTDWIIPPFKVGEVVAVAQSYEDCWMNNASAFHNPYFLKGLAGWKNKMFVRSFDMPHQIRITNVRIERLQDISDSDCFKEGIIDNGWYFSFKRYTTLKAGEAIITHNYTSPREAFAHLIDKISGKGTWESNPYVWVYDFELVK